MTVVAAPVRNARAQDDPQGTCAECPRTGRAQATSLVGEVGKHAGQGFGDLCGTGVLCASTLAIEGTCANVRVSKTRTGALAPHSSGPTVLISSLDQAPLPPHDKALKLAELARAHGWWVRVGYAKAEMPVRYFDNGNLAKAAYVLESIGAQFRRPGRGGRAMWHRENGGGWTFEHAFIGTETFGWSRSGKTKLRSILEGIMEWPTPRRPAAPGGSRRSSTTSAPTAHPTPNAGP